MFLKLTSEQFLDCLNIAGGFFYPLNGFLCQKEMQCILKNLCLVDGSPWAIPITLDVPYEIYKNKQSINTFSLKFNNEPVGFLEPTDFFQIDQEHYVQTLFGTNDKKHPGVKQELTKSKFRVAGKIQISKQIFNKSTDTAKKIKTEFAKKGWKTIVGFQTRNPAHRAHEYLQRTALEIFDGLFINPLTGWKKNGDFSEEAVFSGYRAMMKHYYQGLNIILKPLKTAMKYAGPKEAVHHAILRRNMGCTHFIVGRDHAGVMNYYGDYEAHELINKITGYGYDLGIEILLMKEPVFCNGCGHVVTEKSCSHNSKYMEKISGTKIRLLLEKRLMPPKKFMREEVSEALMNLGEGMFINS